MRSYKEDIRGCVLEGSSRSGKTYSVIDFIGYICANFRERQVINIIKETSVSFKTTLYDDFSSRLDSYGLDNPFERKQEISTFNIFNHKINFLGADKPSKFQGASCDFLWFNEGLDISRKIFDHTEMRCRKFWMMDYNPYVSLHYVYDNVIPRKDVAFLKTTFLDNPYISKAELNKILSYDPSNPLNVEQGTADDYMWGVYGLGKRMSRTGLVYPNVTWIDEFPKEVERVGYALDLGFTNHPTALTKVTTIANNIFAECLIYQPTETPEELGELINLLGLKDKFIWCDSAHPIFIGKLVSLGFKIYGIRKIAIMDGIGIVKSFKIHLVRNHHVQKEQENYAMREVNGIPLDEPVDKFNDFWDSFRYNVLANFRN